MKMFLIGGGIMFTLVWIVIGFITLMMYFKIAPPAMDSYAFVGMLTGGVLALASALWLATVVFKL